MPEHVLMTEIKIITDGSRRRRWTAAEKLRIVEVEGNRSPVGPRKPPRAAGSRQHLHRCASQ